MSAHEIPTPADERWPISESMRRGQRFRRIEMMSTPCLTLMTAESRDDVTIRRVEKAVYDYTSGPIDWYFQILKTRKVPPMYNADPPCDYDEYFDGWSPDCDEDRRQMAWATERYRLTEWYFSDEQAKA